MNAKRVGMVLAGAGARGAYEAGAISVLLPALEKRGERPTVFVGTSAGAINAAFLANRAGQDATEVAEELCGLWTSLRQRDVFRISLRSVYGLMHRARHGVFDTHPLEKMLRTHLGPASPKGTMTGIVTTEAATGRVVVFVAGGEAPADDERKGIQYRRVPRIDPQHVLASAAIPGLFPPVDLDGTWHVDGGVRLNTPIKPALAMKVDRVAIVATDPAHHTTAAAANGKAPDADDDILLFLQAMLAAPLADDMWRLGGINELIGTGRGRAGKKPIGFMFAGPEQRGELGRLAEEVTSGLGAMRAPLLQWLAGRQGEQGRELLTYLLFDPEFLAGAVALGKRDAKRELDKLHGKWRTKRPQVAASR